MPFDGPLLEREYEAEQVGRLVDQLAAGDCGGLLVFEGTAGMGKTRLLRAARAIGRKHDVGSRTARVSPLEQTYGYHVARQLLEASPGVPPDLRGAAGEAGPVFAGTAGPGYGDDRELAVLNALYWLTVDQCRTPTLLLVDDLHHADPASLRYLSYLAGRLDDLPVAIVATVRPGEGPTAGDALSALLADSATRLCTLRALRPASVATMVGSVLGSDVDPLFATACAQASAGNPFLVQVLAGALQRDRVEPSAAAADRVRPLAVDAIARYIGQRVAGQPAVVRAVAAAVAVLGSSAGVDLVAEVADCSVVAAADAVDRLVAQGVMERDPAGVAFAHPLIADALLVAMAARDVAERHERAAVALTARRADPERIAAHLLVLPARSGAQVVEELRSAAEVAQRRGAPESAFAYLRRILGEDLPAAERFRVATDAGRIALQLDLDGAQQLLTEAATLATSDAARADVLELLGQAYGFLRRPDDAFAALEQALRVAPPGDEDRRWRLLASLAVGGVVVAGRLPRSPVPGPTGNGVGERLFRAARSLHRAAAVDPTAVELTVAALADGILVARANGDGPVVCAWISLLAADHDLGLRSLDDAVLAANGHGSVRALAAALTFRSLGLLWRGQLTDAATDARAALDLALGGRVDLDPRFAGAYLAETLLELGDVAAAAEVLARVGADRPDVDGPGYYAAEAQARLLRRTGRPAEALLAAERAGAVWAEFGFVNPAIAGWRSEAALSAHATGDLSAARRWAAEEVELARNWPGPRALGRALRVSGLVNASITDLAESVEVLTAGPARLEYARSLVEWGAALRRAGHRTQARDALGRGLEAAEICGAEPLVEQALAELRIAGARPRRRYLSGPDALTAGERRVVELAAAGAGNQEIAQTLFVTGKTVEVHLTNAYRKLGVAGRRELAGALGR